MTSTLGDFTLTTGSIVRFCPPVESPATRYESLHQLLTVSGEYDPYIRVRLRPDLRVKGLVHSIVQDEASFLWLACLTTYQFGKIRFQIDRCVTRAENHYRRH